MVNPTKPETPGQGVRILKVPVSESTYNQLHQQAQAANGFVSSYCSPVLAALGRGEIKPMYEQVAPAAAPPEPGLRERLLRLPRLTPAERAVLAYVLESFQAAGGKCVVDTNREIAAALGLSLRAVSGSTSQLEAAGWLRVKLHASGANGRQIWPTDKLRAACAP